MKSLLKVCGMRDPENIAELMFLKPDYMGFILYPGSKRFIGDLDPEVIKKVSGDIRTTGVFVNAAPDEVLAAIETYQFKAVQLHGAESPDDCAAIKGRAEVIKAFGIHEQFDFTVLNEFVGKVDYFLFDTQTADHGGSGKVFNWELLNRYTLNIPYFLSGGIGPDSIQDLNRIEDPRCYAIDINSKFELLPGLKDIQKIRNFIQARSGSNTQSL